MKRSALKLTLLALTLFIIFISSQAAAQSIVIDDFEGGLRVINPSLPMSDFHRYLWHQYPNGNISGPGTQAVTTAEAHDGQYSLQITANSGGLYPFFFPFHSTTSIWDWVRQQVLVPANWQFQTYNRLKFWIKVPSNFPKATGGRYNVSLGTYLRASSTSPTLQESPDTQNPGLGHHYYHWYNVPGTGEWHQIIIDSSPEHQRDQGGDTEIGDKSAVIQTQYGDPWNYWDALEHFYLEFFQPCPTFPCSVYLDSFQLYADPNASLEDINEVGGLNAVYVPSTNKIVVGWTRNKNNNASHELRYAFKSIHSIGWNSATSAPGSPVSALGQGGYNMMEYETTAINVTGQPTLYIGIRPVGQTLFREIAIPTGKSGDTTPPAAPKNLRIQ